MGSANATTITAAGGTGGAQFITSTGVLLTAANTEISVGTYSGSVFTAFSPADASPIDISTVDNPSFFGKWAGDTSDISSAANAFNGAQIWFRVIWGLGEGQETVIYLSGGQIFPNNNNGVGDAIAINSNTLTILGAGSAPGSAAYNSTTNQIVIGVPEPSAALLGLLGAVGLIRRRR